MKKLFYTAFLLTLIIAGYAFISTTPINTRAKLGEKLFFEKILSKDSSVSCASCHKPDFGFADTSAFSLGIHNRLTKRNTPSVLNMKNRPYFFWDGRAESLEKQALMPISNPDEMGLPIQEAIERLNKNETYKKLFINIFGTKPNAKNLAAAFAAFEKTLETGDSKFDLAFDNKGKLSAQEERGRQLFLSDETHCFDCHKREDFTTDEFKNIGLYDNDQSTDKGRFEITKDSSDLGKFKIPGLRNIAHTAPYMHDGRFKTLEEVVEYYNNTSAFVSNPINIDETVEKPMGLSKQDKTDLVAFLKTLTGKKQAAKIKK